MTNRFDAVIFDWAGTTVDYGCLYLMTNRFDAVIFDWAGTTVDYGCFAPRAGVRGGVPRVRRGADDG